MRVLGSIVVALLLANSLVASSWESQWPTDVTRVWPGPDTYANRFLDWRVSAGRLECLTGNSNRPMRTVQLITHVAGDAPGTLQVSVTTGSLRSVPVASETAWTGFLIGVGGPQVDYRVSALCHHWPAEDGGLLVAVDGRGRVVFRDNSQLSSTRPKSLDAWPAFESSASRGSGFGGTPVDLQLQLRAEPTGENYKITLSARSLDDDQLISEAVLEDVAPHLVNGNVALVSHVMGAADGPGFWFKDWRLSGSKVEHHPEREVGPVLAAQHTLSEGVLKLTAQMAALGAEDTQVAQLQIQPPGSSEWQTVAEASLQPHSYVMPFRVENWQGSETIPYRVHYGMRTGEGQVEDAYFGGEIRAIPSAKESLVVAAFTGHHISAKGAGNWNFSSIWYPHNELGKAVAYHEPDVLFFSGDQIYEGGLAGIVRKPVDLACLDYLYHWVRWCLAFRDLARNVPCICIPDDHDVYHGNIWGAGGRKAVRKEGVGGSAQDAGGYTMDAAFVNAVHATQTSHLPDPVDPAPIEQDISVYFTRMEYAGVSFAILADRMFKSSPSVMVPEGRCINGWFREPGFDAAAKADVPGAVLLGDRQLRFLEDWVHDWRAGAWMKVALSQTIFANVATLPASSNNDSVVPSLRYAEPGEYIEGDQFAADADSNSWPQAGRNNALRILRKGFVFHLAGDQHLGSFSHYGVDDFRDAGYAFCVPSVANVWPRRWFPPEPGLNRPEGAPLYCGDFHDGFGNKLTVHAVSNPVRSGVEPEALYDRAPGYGIVRLHRGQREITVECWPRWVDPAAEQPQQYFGWPQTVTQRGNYSRKASGHLPTLQIRGLENPVVQVIEESSQEILYTLRVPGTSFSPWVFGPGNYSVRVGDPDRALWKELSGLQPAAAAAERVVEFSAAEEPLFAWSKLPFTTKEYQQRRARIAKRLEQQGGGVFLVPARQGRSHGETFRQLNDFLYFTGLEVPDSMLALDSSTGRSTLFLPARDARLDHRARRNDFPGRRLLDDPLIAQAAGIEEVRDSRQLTQALRQWVEAGRSLWINAGRRSMTAVRSEYLLSWSPADALRHHVQQVADQVKIENAYEAVARVRMVKSPAEVEVLRRACRITAEGIAAASRHIRSGVDERTLEAELEAYFKRSGSQRLPFASIIKSGPNSLWPWRLLASHYDRRNRAMHAGELVIFDVGCELDYYASDVGRTFPVSGKFTAEQAALIEMQRKVVDAVLAHIRPGVTLPELQKIALDHIPEEERRYMQAGGFFGHHIGLDVGDPSLLEVPLEPGMVFTVEPWYYNHDKKVAVFLEENVLVTEQGVENLTGFLARTPEALERLMAGD